MHTAPVSVIIPCYCASKDLFRAVNSVILQSLQPYEIILVDDASTDSGITRNCIAEIINNFSSNTRIQFKAIFLEENQGPGGARNAGWDAASQPFIAFLDADDSWLPDKISLQYNWMTRNPHILFTCHDSVYDNSSLIINSKLSKFKEEILKKSLLVKNSIETRTVMIANFDNYRFPTNMRYCEDYWLWLNMAFNGIEIVKIKIPLAVTYKHPFGEGGLSGNLLKMHYGVIDCFINLYNTGKISIFPFFLLISLEKLKFYRRILITKIKF